MIKEIQIHELGELFEAVQMNDIFEDSKTFTDCVPKRDLDAIRLDYLAQKYASDFDLKAFVMANFDLPKRYSTDYKSDATKSAQQHIEDLWTVLMRKPDHEKSALINLPFPYIVPGGRFGEVYYWDSYFVLLGLQVSRRMEMIQHIVDNFSYLINEIGYIPNGNRTYFLGRSQPPFYSLMVKILAEEKGNHLLATYLSPLEKEYHFWMNHVGQLSMHQNAVSRVVLFPDGVILNRYWDEYSTPRPESYREDVKLVKEATDKPEEVYRHIRAAAESGWDFSSRWFKEAQKFSTIHTTDLIPIDLNCLIWHLEKTLAESYQIVNKPEIAQKYDEKAAIRQNAIEQYCWNEDAGFYMDYDFKQATYSPHYTLAGAFPLFFRLANQDQAERIAHHLEYQFLKDGGLVTTLENTGQQWDAPNGWAPLQWIAYKGLKNYGLNDLADEIKKRWMATNLKVYQATGKMTEKYNVCDKSGAGGGGEYPNQDGFGWTNGVLLAMLNAEI